MPKGTSCCSACTSSHSTSAPVLTAPEHQPVVHHEGLAGPGGWWQQLQSYPSRCWARRGGSSMCPDRLRLYTKCALMCLQGLSGQNHVGIPVRAHRGCALTCALKNRAYGASVPAGGVCLQGQFYGTVVVYLVVVLQYPCNSNPRSRGSSSEIPERRWTARSRGWLCDRRRCCQPSGRDPRYPAMCGLPPGPPASHCCRPAARREFDLRHRRI